MRTLNFYNPNPYNVTIKNILLLFSLVAAGLDPQHKYSYDNFKDTRTYFNFKQKHLRRLA